MSALSGAYQGQSCEAGCVWPKSGPGRSSVRGAKIPGKTHPMSCGEIPRSGWETVALGQVIRRILALLSMPDLEATPGSAAGGGGVGHGTPLRFPPVSTKSTTRFKPAPPRGERPSE